MKIHDQLFIDGAWRTATGDAELQVTDSYTEEPFASYRTASPADVDAAVRAARAAFAAWSVMPLPERVAAVRRVGQALRERSGAIANVISREVGMPLKLAARIQAAAPIAAWELHAELATQIEWEERIGHSLVQQVAVGVVACITPWNYPLHQVTAKLAPALLAGCTVVLKPSELAPSSAFMLAEAIEAAGLPPGVFNLVHGTGPEVGEALVKHPEVDMVSLTGSTAAGRRVAALAAADIKRVALELGGKSASVVLPGADLAAAVKATLASCYLNSGQTCSATTRLLVPRAQATQAAHLAAELSAQWKPGDPADPATRLGPLVSAAQRAKVRAMVQAALAAGAELATSDTPLPAHGFFVAPTVLKRVTPDMAIAREEVFGPVLALIDYDDEDDAVSMANGTEYGLAAAVWAATPAAALPVARRLRAGQVDINGAPFNPQAPFGGFKRSGIGRENGRAGIEEFLEPVSLQLPATYFETP
ncbi:aldehyde dehydrogenase family protein [Ramlibacter albus]|uniref:Toluenesulfonate aldehyde dehydrogenase TsaD n=1 Tax=Ramlibacter albus TaxID=2079448 RepID=A0A923MCT5_9BURK|nr:aldehyde dehydrogenase family protein [Ramlibacter albus]MBC5767806.1 aldehyde dehydrogenase family protein [Ramlibacter albus]